MTPALPFTPTQPYALDPDLQDPAASDAVYRPRPDEASREELLLQKLGARGWGRLHLFRCHYNQGWGEASRSALSPRALGAFFRFLEKVSFPPGSRQPSLFLTDEGGLELVWEDAAGQSVQVAFRPDGIEYSRPAWGEEGEAAFGALEDLARRLSV